MRHQLRREQTRARSDPLQDYASAGRLRRCRRCKAAAADPPLLTVTANGEPAAWFLCEYCWLVLEIGFHETHPQADFYQFLIPLDRRPRDFEVYLYLLRGAMIVEHLGKLSERSGESTN
jgi:hypothetical protein